MQYAPIVLFVFNRLEHTKSTINSLKLCVESSSTELYIFSDGSRDQRDYLGVKEVREYLSTVTGFKKVNLIFRETNYGLAKNIQEGITKVINSSGKVIVLEDDLILSPSFLKYMNHALDFYQDQKSVWHVSGWNYPVEFTSGEDAFFLRVMNCWGWGTWKDRWSCYEKNPTKIIDNWSRKEKRCFNLDNRYNFFKQIELNEAGKLNTWAVFWYATIFENNGLCLNPKKSLVENTGLDGSGQNCSGFNIFSSELDEKQDYHFPCKIEEDINAVHAIKRFYLKYTLFFPVRVFERIKERYYKSFS